MTKPVPLDVALRNNAAYVRERGLPKAAETFDRAAAEIERLRQWKTLALGMAAHLELQEKHMRVETGTKGAAHAAEGRELREEAKAHVQLVRAALKDDKRT